MYQIKKELFEVEAEFGFFVFGIKNEEVKGEIDEKFEKIVYSFLDNITSLKEIIKNGNFKKNEKEEILTERILPDMSEIVEILEEIDKHDLDIKILEKEILLLLEKIKIEIRKLNK